jgi:predicted aspartyl protease
VTRGRARRRRRAAAALLLALAACAAAPHYGPRTTVLPDGGVSLPARFARGVCLLAVDLPGLRQPQTMLLDTGTDRTLFDLAAVHAMGLRSEGDEPVLTATGATVAGVRLQPLPWLRAGDVRFEQIDAVGLDLSALREHGGLPIVGIAGCDLFRQCLLEIDYPRRIARVLPLADAPMSGGHAFAERSPWVTLELCGTTVRALVDTGFQQSLALPPGTSLPWRREPRLDGDLAAIDGIASKAIARVDGTLRLGGLEWRDPLVVLAPGAPKVGAALLRNCIVRLDAGNGRIWIDRAN